MTKTDTLLQQVADLFTSLKRIEALLNDLNSKVDYLIEIYGLNKDIDKHSDLTDWTENSQ